MAFGKKKKKTAQSSDGFDNGYSDLDYSSTGYDDTGYSTDSGYSTDGGYDTYGDDMNSTPVKKKKKKSSPIVPIITVLVIAAVLVGGFFAVTNIAGPGNGACEETILEFQQDAQTLNVDAVKSVIGQDAVDVLNSYIALGANPTDDQKAQMLLKAIDTLGSGVIAVDDEDAAAHFADMTIIPESYGMPGLTRNVTCTLNYGGGSAKVVLTIKKASGKAYIAGIKAV